MQQSPFLDNDVRIEWLILADAAEARGGKLYMLGGGWDRVNVNKFPFDHRMSVAVSILVPWGRTNERHTIRLELVDEDGKIIAPIDGQLEVGRPPGAVQGQPQRALIAFNIAFKAEKPGTYSINGFINGEPRNRAAFTVIPVPGSPASRPPQPPAPKTGA